MRRLGLVVLVSLLTGCISTPPLTAYRGQTDAQRADDVRACRWSSWWETTKAQDEDLGPAMSGRRDPVSLIGDSVLLLLSIGTAAASRPAPVPRESAWERRYYACLYWRGYHVERR